MCDESKRVAADHEYEKPATFRGTLEPCAICGLSQEKHTNPLPTCAICNKPQCEHIKPDTFVPRYGSMEEVSRAEAEKAFAAPTLNYTPRGDRVIVKVLDRPEAPEGVLSAPKSQQKPLDEGIVFRVGPDPSVSDIRPGQHVCFLEFAGADIDVDGVTYKSLRGEEIHGVRG